MTGSCDRCGGATPGAPLYFELEHPGEDGEEVVTSTLSLCRTCAGEVAAEALKVSVP